MSAYIFATPLTVQYLYLASTSKETADLIPARSTANLLSEGWKPGARKCMCAQAYAHTFVLPNDLITTQPQIPPTQKKIVLVVKANAKITRGIFLNKLANTKLCNSSETRFLTFALHILSAHNLWRHFKRPRARAY